MEELISEEADLEIEHFILVALAMNLLVCLQEPVRTMDSGLERHQLVKVILFNYYRVHIIMILTSLVRCPNLPNPLNGQVNQQGNEPGDRATYTCNSGYELDDDDESTRICQNNGQWSGEAPTCERRGIILLWMYTSLQINQVLQFNICSSMPYSV